MSTAFPPHSYLLLVVRSDLSRVSLRLNKPDEASKFFGLISEDRGNKLTSHTEGTVLAGTAFIMALDIIMTHSIDSIPSRRHSPLEKAVATYEHTDHRDWSVFVPWSSITSRAWSTNQMTNRPITRRHGTTATASYPLHTWNPIINMRTFAH